MLWQLKQVDTDFIAAFEPAGEPDQHVIDAYTAQYGLSGRPKHVGIKRWYYFLGDTPRIRLVTIGMPLHVWNGQAKLIVGISEIIGEFEGNRDYVGQKGLKLQMEPIAWLQGQADVMYDNGIALLHDLSEQILDLKAIEQSQETTAQKYRHSPFENTRRWRR